ncbi:hypothetical protein SAMN04487916_10334 [Arthrobacter sp. ov407]|uniref:hypothetical protein n=1 Tax=Arthrobacter sp. ov407 TaxID=1761748 RepID=UPI0008909E8C|nr:hypothetical protein [Arthrobacter sp. ov407]SDK77706.1 hypothetical protein SAMN04487916_10334 [Arthrobacter sp. ov407]
MAAAQPSPIRSCSELSYGDEIEARRFGKVLHRGTVNQTLPSSGSFAQGPEHASSWTCRPPPFSGFQQHPETRDLRHRRRHPVDEIYWDELPLTKAA